MKKQTFSSFAEASVAMGKQMKELAVVANGLIKPDFSKVTGSVTEKAEALALVRKNVTTAFEALSQIEAIVAGYAVPSEGLDDDMRMDMLRMARQDTKASRTSMTDYLDSVFTSTDVLCRQAAAIAYIRASLSRTFEDADTAWGAVHDLINRKIIVENNKGNIQVAYKHYALDNGFEFDDDHVKTINVAVTKFSSHVFTLVDEQRRNAAEVMKAKANISLAEAMLGTDCKKGKSGLCMVTVPSESYTYCATHRRNHCKVGNGCVLEDRHGRSGNLLLRFEGDWVYPVDAIGSIVVDVEKMTALRLRMLRSYLKTEVPPGYSDGFWPLCRKLAQSKGMSEEDAKRYVHGEQVLWNMLQQAINKYTSDEATKEEKLALKAEATVELNEFFGLTGSPVEEGAVGFIEVEGTFTDGRTPLPAIFFLAASHMGGANIELLKIPDHLKGLLGGHVGTRFLTAGNFEKCPGIIRRILRSVKGTVERKCIIDGAHADADADADDSTANEQPA